MTEDLNRTEKKILAEVKRKEGQSITDIAKRIGVAQTTAAKWIWRLEGKKLLRIEEDLPHKRVHLA